MTDASSFRLDQAVRTITALWNRTIPKCAKHVETGDTHTRYLHPTKGWRSVSNKRLGIH